MVHHDPSQEIVNSSGPTPSPATQYNASLDPASGLLTFYNIYNVEVYPIYGDDAYYYYTFYLYGLASLPL